ncbi:MAG: hypothetical protein M4579_003699 [Chaenotheca gracillima]|nr:MAG: hypothetical protein M4579_003699 [Chaenotheca gracillima]
MKAISLAPPTNWVIGFAVLALCASIWLQKVSQQVPEPYLDEQFHVRQAQAYCAGRWDVWDPKITTPPGLYVFSAFFVPFVGGDCSIFYLRLLNSIITSFDIPLVASYILRQRLISKYNNQSSKWSIEYASHSAINIGFFPLLFFFSALYYTDIMSTFCVLVSHALLLSKRKSDGRKPQSMARDIVVVLCGLVALSLRQTNIFWVAVFHGGLELVGALESNNPHKRSPAQEQVQDFQSVLRDSWYLCKIYDSPAEDAGLGDYIKMVFSIIVASLAYWKVALRALAPYLFLIGSFLGFVIWNGGVVLGDKSNHVATIHLTQMLYIGPCIVFFFPGPVLAYAADTVLSRNRWSEKRIWPIVYKILLALISLSASIIIVHYNTIIHPFTLADNRHYVFYAFRWTILRHPLIKYVLAPIYVLSGWSVLGLLSGRQSDVLQTRKPNHKRDQEESDGNNSSFVMILLLSTALSVITAPLVEPRYFIVPIIIWRLHLPSSKMTHLPTMSRKYIFSNTNTKNKSAQNGQLRVAQHGKWLLWLESFWFLSINLVTGYIFLNKGFEWPQEPGKVQRFMW